MKRYFSFLLIFTLILAATACQSAPKATEAATTVPEETTTAAVKLVQIIDRTKDGEIATADALEPFFSDENFTYYFPSIMSDYVECVFSDGSVLKFTDALATGKATLADLTAGGILYWAQDADGNFIRGDELK